MKLSYVDIVFIFLILICVFIVGLFIFNIFLGSMSLIENILSSSISLIGCLGLILILKGFRRTGITLISIDLTAFIIQRITSEKSILNTLYFWAFLTVIIYFVYLEFKMKRRSK